MPTSGVITGCAEGFDAFLRSGLDEPELPAEGISAVFCEEKPPKPENSAETSG